MTHTSKIRPGAGPFRLRDLKNGLYQIHSANGPAFEGPYVKIYAVSVGLGVDADDFQVAIDELRKLDHDCAEFGVFGRFIFTKKDSNRKVA